MCGSQHRSWGGVGGIFHVLEWGGEFLTPRYTTARNKRFLKDSLHLSLYPVSMIYLSQHSDIC